MKQIVITFKPRQVTRALLSPLSERAQEIIKMRYGLGSEPRRMTLEAIGERYDITRERVRQVESFALASIRKSQNFGEITPVFNELKEVMSDYGGIVHERDFLKHVSPEPALQNHIHFLLVVGDYFERLREDEEFHHRWVTDKELGEQVHTSLRKLYKGLSPEELVSESDIIIRFLDCLREEIKGMRDKELAGRWLRISKTIGKNPLGEWGVASSPNVRARGIRDLAYLVLRQHGSPMHFTEVARAIEAKFGRKAHVATCHNELIKDKRFVLVGRGLYALREWGYERGIVKDVIKTILAKEGPLKKEDVVDRVLKERHVKENTILVNLQNSKHFKRDRSGRYMPV